MKSISTPGCGRPGFSSIRTRFPHLLLAGAFLVATGAQSQAPSLVEDIYPGFSSTASAGASFDAFIGISGGKAFLNGSEDGNPGLWRTDGTAAGTTFVSRSSTDASVDTKPSKLTKAGRRLFFAVDDGIHGTELWASDGTSAGTRLVKDVTPGPAGTFGTSAELDGVGEALLFSCHYTVDCGLWKSDETEAGTVLVHSHPSSVPLVPSGALLFWVDRDVDGLELWRSDGTPAGTTLVEVVEPGSATPFPNSSVSIPGGALLFIYNVPFGHWRSDGTSAGTLPVQDPVYRPNDGLPAWLSDVNGTLLFSAVDAEHGQELWSLPVPTKLHTIVPCRVAETRDPAGPTGGAPLGSSETVIVQVTGRCGIPSTALSIAANVTVVSPSAAGSLSVFAGGPIVSGTTEVPVTAGKTRALHFIPGLGTAGSLSFRPSLEAGGSTDVILDVNGWFE